MYVEKQVLGHHSMHYSDITNEESNSIGEEDDFLLQFLLFRYVSSFKEGNRWASTDPQLTTVFRKYAYAFIPRQIYDVEQLFIASVVQINLFYL